MEEIKTNHAGPAASGMERLMIIDDEKPLAGLIQKSLGRLGYRTESYTDSLDALESFRRQPQKFDLVISDLTMPKMTGLDLARNFLEIRPDIPIILCTGFTEQIIRGKAMAMGVKKFIMKPLIMDELVGIVRSILG